MSLLPNVPNRLTTDGTRHYLVSLVRSLEQELAVRPRRVEGVLYLGGDVPVRIISPNGNIYSLGVDNTGALTTEQVTL